MRAWGVYSVFILEDVASDKRLGRDFCYFLCVAFKIVLGRKA